MKIPQLFRDSMDRYKYVFLSVHKGEAPKPEAIIACTDPYTAMTICSSDPPTVESIGLTLRRVPFSAARAAFLTGGCYRLYVWTYEGLQSRLCDPTPAARELFKAWFEAVKTGSGVDILTAWKAPFTLQNEP